jgi:AcrR family transcriptional regulator
VTRSELEPALIYSSPAIHARRKRILDETRKLIVEKGFAQFNMNEICERAEVSKRTLYNAFQTKERMAAIAISEYFGRYIATLPYQHPVGSIQRNIERLVFVIHRNRQIRNYIMAIMSIYFSPDAENDIRQTMHAMAVGPNLQWIEPLHKKGQLQPWIEPRRLADDMVRLSYTIIFDWCRGNIADDRIVHHLVASCLNFMLGATRGAARREIEAMLTNFAIGVPNPPFAAPMPLLGEAAN